jgi:hypothetical protein
MRRRRWQTGLTLFGAAGLLLGCEHAHNARNPPDPLLLSKRPIASRVSPGGGAPVVARHEPPAPAGLVLASANIEADTPNAARQPSGPAIPTSLQRDDLNEE